MNILILYTEVMPYNIPVFKCLINKGYTVKVIQIEKRKLTTYTNEKINGLEISNLSTFKNYNEFSEYCQTCKPALIMISEVIEKWYWKIARTFHKKNETIPIVLGSDAQWTGSRNNWIKKILFRITYKKCFTHILSAGLWQCMYALKIGFKREQIITPLYSANNELYHKVDIEHKKEFYPKKFIYTGRLVEVKGIKTLIEAWNSIVDKKGWSLTIIGNGELESLIKKQSDIELKSFLPQIEICKIMEDCGCALVPSLYEPWGLVIHEAAAAGLPIIATRKCGAVSEFVINRYNGYLINEGDRVSLKNAMEKIINSNDSELITMAHNSRRLSYKITPEDVSMALLSLI